LKVVTVLTVKDGSENYALSVIEYVVEVAPDKVVSVDYPMVN